MRHAPQLKILTLVLALLLPFAAQAQELMPAPQSDDPAAQAQTPPPSLTPQQIDQMTAPIALYPDQLVGQVLMASTYPLEIVEATRWLQTPGNAQLTGDQLQAALNQQSWDPSVKSLVAFPQVLSMMDKNLQWTEQLGNAFLAQQNDVSDFVQRLRQQAQAAGNLQSTPQQSVSGSPGDIVIQPANPQVVYVPTYNPQVVYGSWAYPDYPPYYFAPPPGYVYTTVGLFGFGTGIVLADWFWGWDNWDWHNHRIDIDDRRFEALNRGRAPGFSGDVWEHNPSHRHGVPYASPAARAQFQGQAADARRTSRGFAPRAVTPPSPPSAPTPSARPSAFQSSATTRANVGQQRSVTSGSRTTFNAAAQTPRAQPQVQQRAAPVFESFSRGNDVRAQSQRGAYSRASRPATPVSAAPAQRAAPARQAAPAARPSGGGGGQRGGNDRDHH